MYGIFTYIYPKQSTKCGYSKYTIHGSNWYVNDTYYEWFCILTWHIWHFQIEMHHLEQQPSILLLIIHHHSSSACLVSSPVAIHVLIIKPHQAPPLPAYSACCSHPGAHVLNLIKSAQNFHHQPSAWKNHLEFTVHFSNIRRRNTKFAMEKKELERNVKCHYTPKSWTPKTLTVIRWPTSPKTDMFSELKVVGIRNFLFELVHFLKDHVHPWRLTWNIIMEVWFRSFSFLNGWFVGSSR